MSDPPLFKWRHFEADITLAVDSTGATLDFMVSTTRYADAAYGGPADGTNLHQLPA